MKSYDYGFAGAIAATVLATAAGIGWLSIGSSPAHQERPLTGGAEPGGSEPEAARHVPAPSGPAAIRVHGVVTGAGGEALAGVRVRPDGDLAPETLTGPQGRYALVLPFDAAHTRPALRFLADGYEDGHALLEAGAATARADVRLEPRRLRTVVSGRVIGRSGEAAADEVVELESDQLGAMHTARTDGEGRFFIPDVAVSDDYELRIRPRGPYLQLWQFPLEATRSGLDLELVLEPLPDTSAATSTALRLH